MLSSTHFYHRITRKMVVLFGTMFNNIRMVRYNKAGTQEIERITVPLTYAPKEKFYSRLQQDPNLNQAVQLTLPRMSFEMTAITYDPLRKTSLFNRNFETNNSTSVKSVRMAPYNFDFNLNIYVRNTEDGTQIVEQILPYFSPDYTLTADLSGIGNPIDIPIILQNVGYDPDYTGGPDPLRVLTWTLSFSMKSYLYGPTSNVSVIRNSIANTHIDRSLGESIDLQMTFDSGTRNFKIGELIYEGNRPESANATAYVKSWDPVANQLVITESSGVFQNGQKIYGAVTGAAWTLSTVNKYTNQVAYISVVSDPLTANANDDFGFTEVYQEFPFVGNIDTAGSTIETVDDTNLSADDNN